MGRRPHQPELRLEVVRAAVVGCGGVCRVLESPPRLSHLRMAELFTGPGAPVSQCEVVNPSLLRYLYVLAEKQLQAKK